MAINSNGVLGDKNPLRSLCSSKTSDLSSCRLIKINFAGKESSGSRAQAQNYNKDVKSPYFTNDKIQVLSRVTGKKTIHKKPTEFITSFPMAASVYKSNSDELKLKQRGSNKVKKSVLTLPNDPVPNPKTYTVSDLNDSEYFNAINDNRINKPKKRRSLKRSKKSRVNEICDRDARYCAELNIDLDCSSSEIVNFTGDGERISKLSYKSNNSVKTGNCPQDVWSVLKNIKKFRFIPSPPNSQKSLVISKKRRPIIRKSNNSNDTRFIERCTEEIYISSFEVDGKGPESCSPSSSFDRITVIDKQSDQGEIIQQFNQSIFGKNINIEERNKTNINNKVRGRNKLQLKNNTKKVQQLKKKTDNYHDLSNNTDNKTSHLKGETAAVENYNDLLSQERSSIPSSICKSREICSESSIGENDSIFDDHSLRKKGQYRNACTYNNIKPLSKNPHAKVNVVKPIGSPEKQLNGISKVILSRGNEIVSRKLSEPQRRTPTALALPNTNIFKLSLFEIRKRLAKLKFPIVVLGKEQVTNRGICVANVDTPQFDGLDKHIWPFMLEWGEEAHSSSSSGNIQLINRDKIKFKNSKVKNKITRRFDIPKNIDDLCNDNIVHKKVEHKMKNGSQLPVSNDIPQPPSSNVPKHKPLFNLKNKMYNLLNKNVTSLKPESDWSKRQIETGTKYKDVGTSDMTKKFNDLIDKWSLVSVYFKEDEGKFVENKMIEKPCYPVRHSWAKGKWASDFIENIIKKVRNGVYYDVVGRKEIQNRLGGSEISTQTEINAPTIAHSQYYDNFDLASTLTTDKVNLLQDIPGFDKTLSTLEIETISTNEIAVKHRVTNVVIHFDIQVMDEAKNVTHTKKSMACIPVHVKDNQEKVFKCNTSIINAILPAELCSIIPTVMRNLLGTEDKSFQQPVLIENLDSYSTIVPEYKASEFIMNSLVTVAAKFDKIIPILNGRFQNIHSSYMNTTRTNLLQPTERIDTVVNLFPRLQCPTQIMWYFNQSSAILDIVVNTSIAGIEKPDPRSNRSNNKCMALQLYDPKMFSIVPFSRKFSITHFIMQIVEKAVVVKVENVNELNKIKIIRNDFTNHNTNIVVSRPILIPQNENVLPVPLSGNKFGVISLYNAFNTSNQHDRAEDTLNATNFEDKKGRFIPCAVDKTMRRKKQPMKVLRKKSYGKSYRKCNSMSSISSYKSTPLNKVTNLEEFSQVLGSNSFCNVLDGCLKKKLMDAVEEMKSWITDISPSQALLILLLTNKKDTPHLIRFRPVLLQGIAVNRITKADELDTEIEVIERENMYKSPQCEGFSYLPASPKSQDNLLEELCWIAKTTASDYQKTFDESSEKLLKSLLEKRKKLNPSYLRVMARYVGLGLLGPRKS